MNERGSFIIVTIEEIQHPSKISNDSGNGKEKLMWERNTEKVERRKKNQRIALA